MQEPHPSNRYSTDDDEESDMAPLHPLITTTADLELIDSHLQPLTSTIQHRAYKRRFFGLIQLVLLNIIISWDWLTFSAVSTSAAQFFEVTESSINWLSTGFLFAFVAVTPLTVLALRRGPKTSIVISALLLLVGNWVRYAGTRAGDHGHFGLVVVGQVIIGFAQPFVLAAPTRYSDVWFTDKGRVSATAVASLANPFGGALGQLIGPLWISQPNDVPNMVLYTAIISCVACLPSFFIPARPPTPPSSLMIHDLPDLNSSLKNLCHNKAFILISIAFGVYVGFFNAMSSLINQIMEPYGFSETEAGIAGAILIIVGLVAAAIVSPLIDRTKHYLRTIQVLVPLIAIGYLILIFAPETQTIAAPYIACAILGAASFSLLPCALEYLCEITYPVSPEISSTLCWAGGQFLGAVFVIIMDALKGGISGEPTDTMKRALIFQAVVSWAVIPCAYALNFLDKDSIRLARNVAENAVEQED